MPPTVQSLDQILAQLDPAYAPSRNLYNQQLSVLPGQQTAAIQGLDVAKQNAFRDVNTNANSKGLAFSGIPAAEQTRYVGEKYLPARAGVESDFQKQTFTLQQALASLEQERRLKATDTQAGQQKTLQDYLDAERQRQFQASQAALDRQLSSRNASLSASSRGGGGRAPTAQEVKTAVAQNVASQFNKLRGRDGKVSNETWANGLNDFTAAGGSVRQFWQNYGSYVNGKFGKSYAGYNAR